MAGSSALQSHNWVGQHIPLHATSNGKVLLSELEPDKLEESLGSLSRLHRRRRSPARPSCARSSSWYAEQGYSVAVDELEIGLTAVAAPIRNAHGDVVASISVSGPTFRLTEERMETVIPQCVEAGVEISHRLGWGVR